jgi:hypothetical protein
MSVAPIKPMSHEQKAAKVNELTKGLFTSRPRRELVVRQTRTFHLLPEDGGIGMTEVEVYRLWMQGKNFVIVDPKFCHKQAKDSTGMITCSEVSGLDKIQFYVKVSPRKGRASGILLRCRDIAERITEIQHEALIGRLNPSALVRKGETAPSRKYDDSYV